MKVVLLDNIKGIGRVGDVKEVNDGYARNFLLPRRLASPVTQGVLKDIEILKAKKSEELKLAAENAKNIAESLKDASVTFLVKSSEKGTLFDGIEAKDIAKKMKHDLKIDIDSDRVILPQHIKTIGEYIVDLELAEDITAQIKVLVNNDK